MYARRRAGADLATGPGEVTWLGGETQTLDEHGRRVGEAIRRLGEALGLTGPLVDALVLAGRGHDTGKSRRRWQLAAGVPRGGPPLAKSRRGRFRLGWLGGYRHEFASVADAERALPDDTPHRDLIGSAGEVRFAAPELAELSCRPRVRGVRGTASRRRRRRVSGSRTGTASRRHRKVCAQDYGNGAA